MIMRRTTGFDVPDLIDTKLENTMNAINRKGMTLLEVLIASSILSVLAMLALSAFLDVMRTVDNQDSITRADQRANKAMRDIANALRPAILPIPTNSETKNPVFADIDDPEYGFSTRNGRASDWLKELRNGMDAVAFVVPLDAQGVKDFLDDNGHLQIGQLRNGISYLGATPSGTPNSGSNFFVREPTEIVNALVAVDPAKITASAFENSVFPSDSQWNNLYDANVGPVTAFTIIRFVPVVDDTGNPIVIQESGLFERDGIAYDVDLDGDGASDGSFHIGSLQLLYSGGSSFYHVSGTNVPRELVEPMAVAITPNVVLRRSDGSNATPIFQLMNYDNSQIQDSGDNAGMIQPDTSGSRRSGRMALNIKLLLVDNDGLASEKLITKAFANNLKPRWYESTVILKNMDR